MKKLFYSNPIACIALFLFVFALSSCEKEDEIMLAPATMESFRDDVGRTFTFRVTGADNRDIWGGADGIYTDDSHIGTAAVHAGKLTVGEEKVLRITVLEGQNRYESITQNGITSRSYGTWDSSYRFE